MYNDFIVRFLVFVYLFVSLEALLMKVGIPLMTGNECSGGRLESPPALVLQNCKYIQRDLLKVAR